MNRFLIGLLAFGLAGSAAGRDKAPAHLAKIELQDLSGKKIAYEKVAGKVTVIAVWATWCTPCIMELPYVDALREHYKKDKRVSVLALNVDMGNPEELVPLIKDQIKQSKLKMPVLFDPEMKLTGFLSPGEPSSKLKGKDAVMSSLQLPLLAIVDARGKVYRYFGFRSAISKEDYVKEKKKIIDLAVEGLMPSQKASQTSQTIPRALIMAQMGKADQAEKMLLDALAKNPDDKGILFALVDVYQKMGQPEKSIETARKLLAQDPENATTMNMLGYSLAQQGKNLDEAEQLVRKALAKKPKSGYFMDSLGWVLYQKGQYAEALKNLEEANRLAPGEKEILVHLAETHLKLDQCEAAVELYRKALEAAAEQKIKVRLPGF